MVSLQLDEENSSAKISVPMSLVRLKGWNDKQDLEWKEVDGNLVLKKS